MKYLRTNSQRRTIFIGIRSMMTKRTDMMVYRHIPICWYKRLMTVLARTPGRMKIHAAIKIIPGASRTSLPRVVVSVSRPKPIRVQPHPESPGAVSLTR